MTDKTTESFAIERVLPGQVPMLPGAVIAGGLVFTSGTVAPEALRATTGGPSVPFDTQVKSAVKALLETLASSGSSPELVVRIEAFVASPGDVARWNEEFLAVWPEPGPARTTLVAQFTHSAILFELQAIAVRA